MACRAAQVPVMNWSFVIIALLMLENRPDLELHSAA